MTNRPDDIYVLVCYEEEKIVAILIAHIVGDRNYALLAQAWSHVNSVDAKITLDIILDWCKEKGLSELRAETSSEVSRLIGIKRYGFQGIGYVMSKKVS